MARPLDMGESLIGAYLRYGEKCDLVVDGTQTEKQGEIDVIGFRVEVRRVWLCEMATPVRRPKAPFRVVLAEGRSDACRRAQSDRGWAGDAETEVSFIVNGEYAKRVGVLFEAAGRGTKATPEPFFRPLQILMHVAGRPARREHGS